MKNKTAFVTVIICAVICLFLIFTTLYYVFLLPHLNSNTTNTSEIKDEKTSKIDNTPQDNSTSAKYNSDSFSMGISAKADEIFNTEYADFSVLVASPQNGNRVFSRNSDRQMVSASVIKLFIMLHAYSEIKNGNISDENVEKLIYSMITVSDNDSTNSLIDMYSFDAINATISKYGFKSTVLNRKMLDTEAQAKGIENYTSCDDCYRFLSMIYNRSLLGEKYDNIMLDILKHQQIATKIRAKLPGVSIADKTGELAAVENDVGIIFASETGGKDFIYCVLSGNVKQNDSARNAIAVFAKYLYDESFELF